MSVDTKHPAYTAREQDWKTCRDVLAGGKAIRAAGASYLPKLHGQDADEYAAYQLRAGWFGATARTHEGLTGMVFRKNAVMDLPDSMQDITADVSLDSTLAENTCQHESTRRQMLFRKMIGFFQTLMNVLPAVSP